MQLEITNQEKQPLLHRTLVTCSIKNEKTPTRAEVKELLSAKLGSNKELLFLNKIRTEFGSTDFIATAKLYESKVFADKIESKWMKKRNEIKKSSANVTEKKSPTSEEKKEKPKDEGEKPAKTEQPAKEVNEDE